MLWRWLKINERTYLKGIWGSHHDSVVKFGIHFMREATSKGMLIMVIY